MVSETNEGVTGASRANFADAEEDIRLEEKLATDEDAWRRKALRAASSVSSVYLSVFVVSAAAAAAAAAM
jgi:hypothetical protein